MVCEVNAVLFQADCFSIFSKPIIVEAVCLTSIDELLGDTIHGLFAHLLQINVVSYPRDEDSKCFTLFVVLLEVERDLIETLKLL